MSSPECRMLMPCPIPSPERCRWIRKRWAGRRRFHSIARSSAIPAGSPRSSSPRCGSASATTGCARCCILFMTAPLAAGGLGFDAAPRRRDLRPLHVDGLHDQPAGRLDRRSADRAAARGALRRHPDRLRPLQHGLPVAHDLLSRAVPDRARHRPAQGQRQRDRRPALRARATSAATPGSRSSTWGSTSAPSSRRWSAATSGRAINWHLGFAAAGVGMVLGLIQYLAGRQVPRRRRPAPDAGRLAAARPPRCGAARRSGAAWRSSCSRVLGVGMATGTIPITADAARRRGRLLPAVPHARLLRLAVLRRRLDAGGAQAALCRSRILFLAAALFWSAFEQAGSTLNLFADRSTRTSVFGWNFPSSWFQSMNSAVHDHAGAGVRVALAAAGHAASRRARPSSRSA